MIVTVNTVKIVSRRPVTEPRYYSIEWLTGRLRVLLYRVALPGNPSFRKENGRSIYLFLKIILSRCRSDPELYRYRELY